MKIKELKLYNKYNYIDKPDEYIYIGNNKYDDYFFLYKKETNTRFSFSLLKRLGLNPDKIIKDLNLETGFYNSGDKYIKGYYFTFFSKNRVETYLKPILKDKLKNIINR